MKAGSKDVGDAQLMGPLQVMSRPSSTMVRGDGSSKTAVADAQSSNMSPSVGYAYTPENTFVKYRTYLSLAICWMPLLAISNSIPRPSDGGVHGAKTILNQRRHLETWFSSSHRSSSFIVVSGAWFAKTGFLTSAMRHAS